MKQIKPLSTERLANGAHFLFITDVTECAEADEKLKTKASGEIAALRKALKAEDEALKLAQKNLLSDEIKLADKHRDALYRTLKKAIEAAVNFPVKASADAAVRLRQLLKEYNINPQMQLDRETGMLLNLITDLSGKFSDDVALLGLTPLLTELTAANQVLRTATKQRSNDRMFKIIGQLKLARAASDEAYRALVLKANALVVIEGESDYEAFVAYVNEQVKHYKEEAIAQPKKSDGEKKPGDKKKPADDTKAVEKLLPAFEQSEGFAPGALKLTGKTAKGEGNAKLYELVSLSGDSVWVKVEGGKLVKVDAPAPTE